MKKKVYFFFAFLLVSWIFTPVLHAQDIATQTVYGKIVDNNTKEPLKNVLVELLNYIPLKMTSTNELGEFELKSIPVGKHRLLVTCDEYEILIVPEVEVVSGQQSVVNLALDKISVNLEEILVKVQRVKTTKDNPINHMALTGIRSFTIEEVQRYPASYEDPARLVAKFAGVGRLNAETGVVVRGHNPHTVLWQMEGMPISNPNHMFFNEGLSGFFPIFNIFLLQNSDFMNGGFTAEYGNAISGILDLSLRNGNNRNFEGSIKASINALEGFVEGPLNKKGTASFVAGGRYGILHLIVGLPIIPSIGDFSFKINAKTKKGELNIWGVGGISSSSAKISALSNDDVGNRFLNDYQYRKTYGLLGLSYKHQLGNKKGYVNTILGSNYNLEQFDSFTDSLVTVKKFSSRTLQNTIHSYLHYLLNDYYQIRTGINASHYFLDFNSIDYKKNQTFRNYTGHTFLLQAHAQLLVKVLQKLKFNLGVNVAYLSLNNTYAISPRASMAWQFLASHRLSSSYTWGYQMQSWETYLNSSSSVGDYGQMVDKQLGFSRTHALTLAYDWTIENNWRLKAEVYGQFHTDIPVNIYQPEISLVNQSYTQNFLENTHFVNNGIGYTYGVELTVEKFFSEGYYGMLTATYFDSKYRSTDEVWRNIETNSNMVANLLFGKEFKIGKQKSNAFFFDISYAVKLGNFYTPVNLPASVAAKEQVLDWTKAYTERLPVFNNVDLRIGMSFNHKKIPVSHRIFIEVSNLLNQVVTYRFAYNPHSESIANNQYAGIRPNISYRMNFGFKKNN